MFGVEDAWVTKSTVLHFIKSGFMTGMATRVTIDSCNALDPISIIEGGKRYNFNLYHYSQLVLIKNYMQVMEDTITYQMELQQPLAVCFLIVPLVERIPLVKVIGDGVRVII